MLAMAAREFVDTIAVPTVREFMAEPTRRRGYLACIVAYHLGDYLPSGTSRADRPQAKALNALGRPFLALERMCNAAKHSEATRGPTPPVLSGSDADRPATGLDVSEWGELRFDDRGGRHVEHDGRQYDMLDLCLIAMRAYARLYPSELIGSAIDGIQYSTATYAP